MIREIKGRKVVWGEGPKRAKAILVGESLGENEEQLGRPFVGADGRILDGILVSSHIKREDCYITNVVKVRPPFNKVKRLSEYGLEVGDFIPLLEEELATVDAPVIIPLGDLALNVICNRDGIMKWRGSILDSDIPTLSVRGIKTVPTFNPGFVREFWQARGTVVEDLKKAIRVGQGKYENVKFNTVIRPEFNYVEWFIKALLELDAFSYDIEVFRSSNQIACVGIGGIFGGQRLSLCIPFKHKWIPQKGFTNYWERNEEIHIWGLLTKLFQSDLLKIGQNVNYDITFLAPIIGEPSFPWYDTLVAHHTLDPELPHDLAYLTSRYTDVQYYKDDPKEEGDAWSNLTPSEQLWEYNGKDVEVPLMIEPILTRELKEEGVWDFFRAYQMPLVRAMWRIQQRGMWIDEEMKEKMKGDYSVMLADMSNDLNDQVGHPLNVSSPKQMMKFLYEELKLPVQRHRKTRQPTANKEALDKLFARYPNPIFKLALDIRALIKDIGTYLATKPSIDGKYRGRYNVCGTETGRSSSSKTYYGDGFDMQNIPPELRTMFIAPEGRTFLIYDLWQAEAYCVAVFARVRAFLDRLRSGRKIHTLVASWITGRKEEEINGEAYDLGKRTVHASNYGLGPNLFATLIKQPVKIAKGILATYHRFAPEIESWHKEVQHELERSRKLVTPFGRIRYFRNRQGEEMYREAYAHLPQSTIADYCHQAILRVEYSYLKGAEIVQEGFDGIVVESDDDKKEVVDKLVRESFCKVLLWKGEKFEIPVEGKEGKRWIK